MTFSLTLRFADGQAPIYLGQRPADGLLLGALSLAGVEPVHHDFAAAHPWVGCAQKLALLNPASLQEDVLRGLERLSPPIGKATS